MRCATLLTRTSCGKNKTRKGIQGRFESSPRVLVGIHQKYIERRIRI